MSSSKRAIELSEALNKPINEFDILLIDNPKIFNSIVLCLMIGCFVLAVIDMISWFKL